MPERVKEKILGKNAERFSLEKRLLLIAIADSRSKCL
jgi:hypothetical protein